MLINCGMWTTGCCSELDIFVPVGVEAILGVMTVVGGSGLFLTFWRSLGGPPGEQDVNKKHVF